MSALRPSTRAIATVVAAAGGATAVGVVALHGGGAAEAEPAPAPAPIAAPAPAPAPLVGADGELGEDDLLRLLAGAVARAGDDDGDAAGHGLLGAVAGALGSDDDHDDDGPLGLEIPSLPSFGLGGGAAPSHSSGGS